MWQNTICLMVELLRHQQSSCFKSRDIGKILLLRYIVSADGIGKLIQEWSLKILKVKIWLNVN